MYLEISHLNLILKTSPQIIFMYEEALHQCVHLRVCVGRGGEHASAHRYKNKRKL